ncbi:hypothetical protein V6N13_027247 [Hibiscus sabdariffa]|uniref:Uncharacterized protein n=2 Tax=Hibiscus sabdariffa TaxID=183260 RepID=A0ABR2NKB4_9ROSI
MAKRAKHKCLLDSLPDSILCHILSFLPTRDAVRTSILSPRWRYLFTSSLSRLDFSDGLRYPLVHSREHMNNFKKFVDRLLFDPKHLRLDYFRVNDMWASDGFLSVYNWLCAALWRGVKEISVDLNHGDLRMLPTLLFVSPSLVKLTLSISSHGMKVPTNVFLPNLRTLHLLSMEFADGCSFPRLISGCPVLECLLMRQCFLNGTNEINIHSLSLKSLVLYFTTFRDEVGRDFDNVFVINAPSLVCFKYAGRVGKRYTFRNIECLEEASIKLSHLDAADRERSATLLRGICNVQTLRLIDHDYDEPLPLLRMPLDSVLVFPNLFKLHLENPLGHRKGKWIMEFLRCVPNLRLLYLDLADADKDFKPQLDDVPPCLFHRLEVIDLTFKGDTHMFEVVSYFLDHALVLNKLVIWSTDLSLEARSRIEEKLSSLPKKTKKCKFIVREAYPRLTMLPV